jgi:hypothetical protein
MAKTGAIVVGLLVATVAVVAIASKSGAAPPTELADVLGLVSDSEGLGIEGVTVTLGSLQTATARDGSYFFTDVTPGSYSMRFQKAGYVTLEL